MPPKSPSGLVLRTAAPEDSSACGQICYDAFSGINRAHGFPSDFPGPEVATGLLSMMFSAPGLYCVVAEREGRIVGSNCLDERSPISGVGPITVDPNAQNLGVGRELMRAVMDRARERGAVGIRLVQAAFHNRSLSLYTSLGFDIREPLSCMQGRTQQRSVPGCTVRPLNPPMATLAMPCPIGFMDLTEAPSCRKPSNRALPVWWSAEAVSLDMPPTWPFSAMQPGKPTWTSRP